MLSSKRLVVFAVLLVVAAAYPDNDEEVSSEEGRGHHGGGGRGHHGGKGRHHHQHRHGLAFFKELNETVVQQFVEIWRDDDLSRDEKKAQINELAESVLTPEQLAEFQRNQAEREQRWQERKTEKERKMAALSPNARAAAERIHAVWHDETLSGRDGWKLKKQKVAEIKAELSESEKEEIESLWGRGRGQRGNCMLKRLSFYKDLDEETKDKFKAIAKNNDLTREQKKERSMQLAQEEFTSEQFSEYERVKAEHEQQKLEKKAEIDAKIASMSPNARVAAEKMRTIMEDDTLEWDEKKTQMRVIKEELSESEQTEVNQLREGHHHGRHRRYGNRKNVRWTKLAVASENNAQDDE
uniref:SXP/RAL-2 family protein Ani s 5-like cation-binding domain-containing protein n=1 Tax=Plectus sambesii TaxID=2011161 RepID=A0A914UTJ5_9BILA